jgi:hypothetical protein
MGFVKHILQLLGLHRSWLTLLALGAAAAFFWWEFATMRAERDRYRQWADVVCASAGAPFAPAPKSKLKAGDQCKAEVAALARFRTDQARLTADVLARVERERQGKADRDLAAAIRAARSAADAAKDMEKANAALNGDHVDPAWFAALNRLAGLQP